MVLDPAVVVVSHRVIDEWVNQQRESVEAQLEIRWQNEDLVRSISAAGQAHEEMRSAVSRITDTGSKGYPLFGSVRGAKEAGRHIPQDYCNTPKICP